VNIEMSEVNADLAQQFEARLDEKLDHDDNNDNKN
jgi:hypothetical protein